MNRDDAARTRAVVVGAGFAGIEAVKKLAAAGLDVTLVDRTNHHLFKPMLYQCATAALSPGEIAWPGRFLFRRRENVRVVMAEATGIDREARRLRTDAGDFPYDHLVIAAGTRYAYFGNEDWGRHAPGLDTLADAVEIRRRILTAFEKAELTGDPDERRRLLTFVVVGGGPTGVEMAGAISEIARLTLAREFRHFDPGSARVVLLEAMDGILGQLPDKLSAYALKALERMPVEVVTGAKVQDIQKDKVTYEGGEIDASVIVWAAGVKASPAAEWLGLEPGPGGRVNVEDDLSVPGFPEIMVIGDTAAVKDEDGDPVPGLAPAAKQMGKHAGRRIAALAKGGQPPGAFRYRHMGDFATIGRNRAIVKMGPVQLTGFIAWALWSVAHIMFLVTARSRIFVSMMWAWNYVTHRRAARLITGRWSADAGEKTGER
jgi:NADH:ubiquinone reductase (H+-translocating)